VRAELSHNELGAAQKAEAEVSMQIARRDCAILKYRPATPTPKCRSRAPICPGTRHAQQIPGVCLCECRRRRCGRAPERQETENPL